MSDELASSGLIFRARLQGQDARAESQLAWLEDNDALATMNPASRQDLRPVVQNARRIALDAQKSQLCCGGVGGRVELPLDVNQTLPGSVRPWAFKLGDGDKRP